MRLLDSLRFDLSREIKSWVDADVIDAEQGRRIAARYDIDVDDQSRPRIGSLAVRLLAFLCIGTAALILIGQNWDEIPRSLRIVGLLSVTLGLNLFGLKQYLSERPERATGWFLLGAICFGASVMLIGQIYHLGEHYAAGVYLWAIGVLPIAFVVNHGALLTLSLALATLWFLTDANLGNFGETYLLFLAVIVVRLFDMPRRPSLAFLTAAGAALYLQVATSFSFTDWMSYDNGAENFVVFVGTLLIYLALAWGLGSYGAAASRDYEAVFLVWLTRCALILLFVFSYFKPWARLLNANFERPGLLFVFIVAQVSIALLIWFFTRRLQANRHATRYWSVPILSALYLIACWVMVGRNFGVSVLGCQVATILFAFAFATGLIVLGVRQRNASHYYTGIGFILLLVVTRYFDLVGDYVTTSALFAVAGLILFATNHYWRQRIAEPAEETL